MADREARILLTAEDRTRAALTSVKRNLGDLDKSILGLSSAFSGLFAAVSAGSFAALVKSAADMQDELGKMSQRVGVGVEALSELNYAAKLSDVSTEQLGTGLRQLARNMQDTAAGTGEAREAFAALGIDVKTSGGALKGTQDILVEVADKFAGMEDSAGKTALAMRLFGRAGAELIPLLNEGASGLAAMGAEARAFGVVVDEQAARAAQDFNDNLERLGVALDGMKIKLGNELLPVLNDFVARLLEASQASGGLFAGLNSELNRLAFGNEPAEQVRNLKKSIEDLEAIELRPGSPLDVLRGIGVSNRINALSAALAAQRQEALKLAQGIDDSRELARTGTPRRGPTRAPELRRDDSSELKRLAAERQRDAERVAKAIADAEEESARISTEAWQAFNDQQMKEYEERLTAEQKMWQQIFQTIDDEQQRAIDEAADLLAAQGDELKKNSDFAKEFGLTFSSAMEDAIVQGENLRDVLKGLAQDLLRIVVRKSITEPLGNAIANALPGFATGGAFTVGGAGGTDSQMVAFRATPGERVTITPPGQGSGGGVSLTYNIDARGAQAGVGAEIRRAIAEAEARSVSRAVAQVSDLNARGAMRFS